MVPATFHFPGQEHQQQQPAVLTSVATGNHKPAETATAKANAQQRRIIALQLAQKQAPDAPVELLIDHAASLERYISSGVRVGDVVAHGATATTGA